MAMELCIVCLKSTEDILSRINIQSSEWQECNIQRIIEKHLWWWYLKKPATSGSSLQCICRQCWLELSSFHNFYLTVQKVHNQYILMPTIYEMTEINKTAAQQKKIKQESEAHTDTCPMEDIKPLNKKQRGRKQNYNCNSIQTDELHIVDIKNEVNLDKTGNKKEEKNADQVDDVNENISTITLPTKNVVLVPKTSNENDCEAKEGDVTVSDDNSDDTLEATTTPGRKSGRKTTKTKPIANRKQRGVSTNANSAKEQLSAKECEELFKETGYELGCSICQVSIPDFRTLRMHFNIKHKTPVYSMCCGKKFTERGLLIDHLNVHKNPEYFKCQRCNKTFKMRSCLESHVKTHEPRERKFNCEECEKSFFNRHLLAAHMVVHDPEKDSVRRQELSDEACEELFKETNYKLECSICQVAQYDFRTLTAHFKNNHNNIPTYAMCCGRKFTQRCFLIDHLNVHKNPKYFKCQPCKKTFTTRGVLERHLRAHKTPGEPLKKQPISAEDCEEIFRKTQYKLECNICQEPQVDFRTLKVHFNKEHKIRAYALCCGKRFVQQSYLIDHLNLHTNSKHFKCPHCNKVLASRRCLQNHVKIHETRERKYSCDECDRSFFKKLFLERHRLALHVTDKTYQCSQCDKKFASKYLRRIHEYHHNRTMPKICNLCQKYFRGGPSFERHMFYHKTLDQTITPIKSEPKF